MAVSSNVNNFFSISIFVFCLIIFDSSDCIEYLLENNKVCSLEGSENTLKLSYGKDSVIILSSISYFAVWTGRYDFICRFTIKGKSKENGIYAVIQNLNLRKNETTGECIDYVLFEESVTPLETLTKVVWREFSHFGGAKHSKSEKYCGKLHPVRTRPDSDDTSDEYDDDDDEYNEDDLSVADNSFVTRSNTILVTIYVGRLRQNPNEKLDLRIAFTSFSTACNRRGSDTLFCNNKECIWHELKDDGVQNCPYRSCLDEDGCRKLDNYVEKKYSVGTGTKVTVGAITAIILTFILFITCLWIGRRNKKLCWATRAAHNNHNTLPLVDFPPPTGQQNVDEFVVPQPPRANTTPTASPTAPPENEFKDLPPPSYESLFPEKIVK